MRRLFRHLRSLRPRHTSLVEIEIFKDRLEHNFGEFQRSTGLPVAPVLKSNAYGHGLVETARALAEARGLQPIPFFAVDSYHEAAMLRNEGIKTPIVIIGFTAFENLFGNKLKNIAFTISSLDQLKEVSKKIKGKINFHLKVDTGMHRQGILPSELAEAAAIIKHQPLIHTEGILSHLADADNDNSALTEKQIAQWNQIVEEAKRLLPQIQWFHLSATSGAFYAKKIRANAMRLGLGLYGIPTNPSRRTEEKLLPALEMRSILSSVKLIPKGEHVGYSGAFTAEKDMTIATVPAGYFEGIDCRLAGKGSVTVISEGRAFVCPFVGKISMNISTIDISTVPNPKIGDRVILISKNPEDANSIQQIAKMTSFPYEILIHIPQHLRRRVI